MTDKKEFIKLFPEHLRTMILQIPLDIKEIREIKFRINKPVICYAGSRELFVNADGSVSSDYENAYIMKARELDDLIDYMGSFSLYAYEDELRQGYLTVKGGHRIGVAGKVILEGMHVKNFKFISCINIRVAHEVKGAADHILPFLYEGNRFLHTLLISPPGCGKTTLLRDIIRQASNGFGTIRGVTVGVVDERSEIGGSYLGVAQNDIGIRTDILDACPKAEGMMMLIRAMAPEIVAVDEIGTMEDVHAMEAVIRCGSKLLATIHGEALEDIKKKAAMRLLMEEQVFERYIILDNIPAIGHIAAVYDKSGQPIQPIQGEQYV